MTFDLTTVLFQLANFALLLVLLRIFLYRPVLKIMDEREELTAAPLREARRLAQEAEQEREALHRQRAAMEQERAEMLRATTRESDELREQRLAALDRESAAQRAAAAQAVEREVGRISDRLRSGLADIVVDEVRQTLAATTGIEFEDAAMLRLAEQLRALAAEQRNELAAAAHANGVRVITARSLSAETSGAARDMLTELLGARNVSFETDPQLLLGVALEAGGVRLDGTATARLERLESTFAEVLRAEKP